MDYSLNIFLEGEAITDVTAEQTGPDTMLISWTPPPAPAAAGYHVQVTVGTTTTTTDVLGTSNTVVVSFGVYNIQVMTFSPHFRGEVTAPLEIVIRGREHADMQRK